jgi:hypothetical protein
MVEPTNMPNVGCGNLACGFCKCNLDRLNNPQRTHYFEPSAQLRKASEANERVEQLFRDLPETPKGTELFELYKAIQKRPCETTSDHMEKFKRIVNTLAEKGGHYEKRGYGDNRGKVTTQCFSGLKSTYGSTGGLGAPVGKVYMRGVNGKNFLAPLSGLVFNDHNNRRVSVKRSTHKRRVTDEGRRRSQRVQQQQRVQQHAKARGLPTDRSK